MLRILHDTKIDFIGHWRTAVIVTVAFVVLGFGSSVFTGWFHASIEFTGGTAMQVAFKQPPDVARVRAALERGGIRGAEIAQFGSATEYQIKAQDPEGSTEAAANAEALANPGVLRYEPEPFGLGSAREAVAHYYGGRLDASRIVLTASTSEAYAWLFKLLALRPRRSLSRSMLARSSSRSLRLM